MRLCITRTTDGATTVLRVDGELVGEGVRELERSARAIRPLRLDLTNLLRADDGGLAASWRLPASGAELANVPPYCALRLEREARNRGRKLPPGASGMAIRRALGDGPALVDPA